MNSRAERDVVEAAKVMDRVTPDWYQRINTHSLNLTSSTDCVLGQVYGHYTSHGALNSEFTRLWSNGVFSDNYACKRPWIREVKARKEAWAKAHTKIALLDLRRPPKTIRDTKVYVPDGWTVAPVETREEVLV